MSTDPGVTSSPRPARRFTGVLLLLLLGGLWGVQFSLIKITLETLPPVTATAGRIAIAALVLLAVLLVRRLGVPRTTRQWGQFAAHGLMANIVPGVLLAWGQLHISSALAGVLNSMAPIFVFLITWLWTRHEPVGWQRLLGVVIGLGGVVAIIGVDALGQFDRGVVGQIAIVLGTSGYAFAAIYARRFSGLAPEVPAACVTIASATLLSIGAMVLERPDLTAASGRSLLALVCSGAVTTGLGMIVYFYCIRTLGALATSAASYLKAGVGVLVGVTVMGEAFTPAIAIGLLAVVVGVVAINEQLPIGRAAAFRSQGTVPPGPPEPPRAAREAARDDRPMT
jgi:drug/metabolite transporter (DMT)-like permease